MSPTATEQYIGILTQLKPGDLGLLRAHAGQGLDESVQGFDLFAGLWWPLQNKSQFAPRREVAWLVAKLYAFSPAPHSDGDTLARQLGHCQPNGDQSRKRFQARFDSLLRMPLGMIEPELRWALSVLSNNDKTLDWVRLTDDLSIWERETTRLKWAEQFLNY
jgi:CRISPR type I-E-associated protein CasB/Cse2